MIKTTLVMATEIDSLPSFGRDLVHVLVIQHFVNEVLIIPLKVYIELSNSPSVRKVLHSLDPDLHTETMF